MPVQETTRFCVVRLCRVLSLALGLVLSAGVPARADAQSPDVLYLLNGERFIGYSHGIVAGALRWKMPLGQELLIPLETIERLELPDAEPVTVEPFPVPIVEPDGPLDETERPIAETDVVIQQSDASVEEMVGPDPQALADALSDTSAPARWTDHIPFHSEASALYHCTLDTVQVWTKRIQVGGQFNEGNTTNGLLDFLAEIENSTERTLRQFDGGGQYGVAKRKTSVNRRWLNGNIDHTLNGQWIVYATTKNEYDQLANLDYRGTLSSGIGYRFFNEPKRRLITRMGPGVTHEIFGNFPFRRTTADLYSETEIRWPLFARTQIEQKMRVNPNMGNFRLVRMLSTSSILFDLDSSERWKLRMSFRFEYNSQPAKGRVPSDYLTTISLVYQRK